MSRSSVVPQAPPGTRRRPSLPARTHAFMCPAPHVALYSFTAQKETLCPSEPLLDAVSTREPLGHRVRPCFSLARRRRRCAPQSAASQSARTPCRTQHSSGSGTREPTAHGGVWECGCCRACSAAAVVSRMAQSPCSPRVAGVRRSPGGAVPASRALPSHPC